MTQNNPLSSQHNRVDVDLRMIDLLLDKQLDLLTGTEYSCNVRWDVSQDQNLPATHGDNREYLFSSTKPEALKDQARRLAVAFVSFLISSSNGSSSSFLYWKGTPTTMQNHSAISLASGNTKTVPSISLPSSHSPPDQSCKTTLWPE